MPRKISQSEDARVAGYLTITAFRNGKKVRSTGPMPNKVVSGSGGYGRNIIARQLAGDTTYGIAVDSAGVGSGSTAPADSDTSLQTAVHTGISITDYTVTNNVLQIDVYVADANLNNTTYNEFGLFCDGQLFARIIISPAYTKVSGEDSLFTYTLTLSG